MDKREFGQLIAALRKKKLDLDTGRCWTQQTLADRANLSLKVVANIEQGRKAHLERHTLAGLADALCLNTWERYTLFALAGGATVADVVQEEAEPAEMLAEVLDTLRALRTPALVYDSLYYVVAVNGVGLALHNLSAAQLHEMQRQRGSLHFLSVALTPHSPLRQHLHQIWAQFVRLHVLRFRTLSLPYRHTHAFQRVFDALWQLDEFREAWAATQTQALSCASALKRYGY